MWYGTMPQHNVNGKMNLLEKFSFLEIRSKWRRLLWCVGVKLDHFFHGLIHENRESVLIIDDSSIVSDQKNQTFFS